MFICQPSLAFYKGHATHEMFYHERVRTHRFIHPLPQNGQDEDGPYRGAEVALHGLDVVEQLSSLGRPHQRNPQYGDSTHEQDEQPVNETTNTRAAVGRRSSITCR